MKIITKEKDYYDYVSKVYGEDEKIIFNRLREIDFSNFETLDNTHPDDDFKSIKIEESVPISSFPYCDYRKYRSIYYEAVVFCGIPYLFRFVETYNNEKYHERITPEYLKSTRSRWSDSNLHNEIEVEHPFWINIHKKLNTPLFVFTGFEYVNYKKRSTTSYINIKKHIPLLKDYNFQDFMEPEQCWQFISQFISLHLISNDPPLELDNKERIVKAGFDLKTSFRGN